MKYFKRIFSLLLVFSLLMHSISFCGTSIDTGNMDTVTNAFSETDGYSYGIFTETYNIQYEKDNNGNIKMSNEDLKELQSLSSNPATINKILNDNAVAAKSESNSEAVNINSFEAIKSIKNLTYSQPDNNAVIISSSESTRAIENLTNFTSNIDYYKVYASPTSDEGFRIVVKYKWFWTYAPALTLTDIVGIGWSDELDGVVQDDIFKMQFNYYQNGYAREYDSSSNTFYTNYNDTATNQALKLRGHDTYTRATPSVSFQNHFDIKRTFEKDYKTYSVYKHYGSMYVIIAREYLTDFDGQVDYTGCFFHQTLKPNATVEYSDGKFGLSATAEIRYDQAKDAYNTITHNKIKKLIGS